ncbi:hypothetical protein G7Y89_g4146 [Cudoniella acicularis]|uniref:Uncharacterized protein n=1 Tax=Cudoniella acicularis TaxID=354080 RepID=A0A8H4RQU9_9HELO|nr:hypothetical protein G7Y89_g4146 [Cudoniella acicularis]
MSEPQESYISQHIEQIDDILKDLVMFVTEEADFGKAANGDRQFPDTDPNGPIDNIILNCWFTKLEQTIDLQTMDTDSGNLGGSSSDILPILTIGCNSEVDSRMFHDANDNPQAEVHYYHVMHQVNCHRNVETQLMYLSLVTYLAAPKCVVSWNN